MVTKQGKIEQAVNSAMSGVDIIKAVRGVNTAAARAEIVHRLFTDLNQTQRSEFCVALETVARGGKPSPLLDAASRQAGARCDGR